MEDPRRKRGRGAGKAPERIVFYREGGPFKPQRRAARSWDDERKGMKMKNGGISGGADEEGRADAVRRCAVCRPNVLKPRSVPARRAAQRRAKQPARPAAIAAAVDGVRLP